MGATKEMLIDMRLKEFTINTTFKLMGKELEFWEFHFRQNLNVIDFKIVSDTNKLYSTDEKFKRLVKAKKAATVACELYINKHNG
jgi:hypothetical protein